MMRSTIMIIGAMIMLMTAMPAKAQQSDSSAVAMAVNKLVKAMEDSDIAALTALTDYGLSYGHSSGKVEDKAAFLEAFRSGASDFVKITITEQHIHIVDRTAIVRHTMEADTNDHQKPGHVRLKTLTVWQQINGAWVLIARQAVKAV